ncbi:hypothetical protein GCM10027091_53770 [Streptomyces daliensis]
MASSPGTEAAVAVTGSTVTATAVAMTAADLRMRFMRMRFRGGFDVFDDFDSFTVRLLAALRMDERY